MIYAIFRASKTIDQRGEHGHRYTIFSESAPAVGRLRSDGMGPGQRLAIEVGGRIVGRDNMITIRWTPAGQEVECNEAADTWG